MHHPSAATPGPVAPRDGDLTLRVLGDPSLDRIAADGSRHRVLGMGKPLALITYLAVAPQHEASREFLADLLWGDDSVSDPPHSLRNALLLIRQQADSTLIDATPTRCRLARPLPGDLACLTRALSARDLERAMATYTGDFLPHFAAPGCRQFEHWCESIRLRVRTDVTNAADVLVRQLLDSGRPRDAEQYARRMIEIDPLNQRGRRILLESLIAAGDRMAAITEAALTEQWLATEEIDPEAATTALLQQARRARPAPRSSVEAEATERPEGLAASTDLVGRATEFAAIINAWESARAGTTTMVSIVAGAGIGKTRLLTDVENRLRAQRAQVVSVRALTNEREVPFALVATLAGELARLPGAAGVSSSTGGVLVGLDSSLSSIFRATTDFATSDQVLRRTRALQELLACVAEERTTVLLLDDLHWADDSSLTVLPALLARLTTSRVLVVTASRPGRGAVLADDRTHHLSLAALTAEQIGQLIASIRPLPQLPWSEALVQGIHSASRGVPLFALLALRDVTTRGLVRVGETTWECNDPPALEAGLRDGAALPTALRDLPQRARRALVQLAVAGRGVPAKMLTDEAEPSPSLALSEALDALERRALITRVDDVVSVAHDVVAESALAGASDDERRAAARSMALAMLAADDRRWQERGVRLFSTVATASELAPRLASFVEEATLPPGVSVTSALRTWLGESPQQRQLARAVARQLPWSLRLRPFRRHLAGAGVAASLFAVFPVWSATHPKAPVDATLIGMAMSGDSAARSFAAPITQSEWDASTLLDARAVRLGSMSAANVYTALTPQLFQRTGERLAERVYGDSGGSEIEVIDARGASTRLTAAPGDDVPNSWSPDGRFVVLETSRWSILRHHQLGILDRATGAIRRLGRSDGSEGGGTWSPDGSRIAFTRHFLDARPSQLCVVDIDGEDERCTTGVSSQATNIGWRTPVEFLVASTADILRVRPDSGWNVATLASDATAATLSPNGRWLAWLAASAPGTAFIAPSNAPVLARRVRWTPGDRPPTLLTWGVKGESAPYIERITITSPADSVVIGVPHRFDIAARWSDSTDAPPPHVRWRLGARGDGDIDSLGTLIARRPGTIVVVASAGGWRATTMWPKR
ncbi:MAG: AAA family ATPase [Gemmatimonadota bacterium]